MEKKIEREAVKWLKINGVWITKLPASPGVPTGAPDRLFVYGKKWGVIEFKASENAPFRPGQRETLQHLKTMCDFVYVVYPENWEEVKKDLVARFFGDA